MEPVQHSLASSEQESTSSNTVASSVSPRKKQICRFFGTKKGCREGDACPYLHDLTAKSNRDHASSSSTQMKPSNEVSKQRVPQHQQQTSAGGTPKAVPRPVPQSQQEDPRAFQIGQIQRRFKPEIADGPDATTLTFKMAPSDPDFPYEIDFLECQLKVPPSYPAEGHPTLQIVNKDMPRGFQINIERGFDAVHAEAPNATLLGLMNRLDKQLEQILSGEMAQTLKLVSNQAKSSAALRNLPEEQASSRPMENTRRADPVFSEAQKTDAQTKRQKDVRQMEARFGRLPSFNRSGDGHIYTIPLDSPKRNTWPAALQLLRSFTMFVPELYPLDPLTIHLESDSEDARRVEEEFRARCIAVANESITQRVNYLVLHVTDMAKQQHSSVSNAQDAASDSQLQQSTGTKETKIPTRPKPDEEDRPHIQIIPRPPEWDVKEDGDAGSGSESDYDSYSYDTGDETEDEASAAQPDTLQSSGPVEKGVLLSLPHLELHGIELLELTTLSVTVKCERCKDTMDFEKLHHNSRGDASGLKEDGCKKCASNLAVGFRADMMHSSSVRAGYLDLDGCTVVDMLPRQADTHIPGTRADH